MNSDKKIDALVHGLGALLGLERLDFDEQGGLGLYLPNGLEVGLRRSDDDSELLIFAVVRVLDDAASEIPDLFRASLLGQQTGGACLSLGEDAEGRDCLVIWRSVLVALVDVQALADALARFADAALAWRNADGAAGAGLVTSADRTRLAPLTPGLMGLRA